MRPSFRNRDTMHPKPSVHKWTFHRFIHSQKQIISKERKLVGIAFLSMLSLFPIGSFLPKKTFPNGSLGIFLWKRAFKSSFMFIFPRKNDRGTISVSDFYTRLEQKKNYFPSRHQLSEPSINTRRRLCQKNISVNIFWTITEPKFESNRHFFLCSLFLCIVRFGIRLGNSFLIPVLC